MAERRGITLYFLFLGILFSFNNLAIGQNGSNPFDLQHRLKNQGTTDTLSAPKNTNPFDLEARANTPANPADNISAQAKTSQTTEKPSNPFDISRPGSAPVEELNPYTPPIDNSPTATAQNTRGGFIFWSLLGVLILLAFLITLYRSLLNKIYRAFSNENVLKLLQREQGGVVKPPYWFWYLLYFANAGIFIFQIARYKNYIPHEFQFMAFCVIGVAAFFLVKHILLKLIESIFPISKEIKQYSFTIIIFNIILGILLVPFNIFIAFAQENFTFGGIILGLLVVGALYLFRLLRSLMISSKYLAFHKFHFFMYLCTIEIAPLLIITKLLITGVGVE